MLRNSTDFKVIFMAWEIHVIFMGKNCVYEFALSRTGVNMV